MAAATDVSSAVPALGASAGDAQPTIAALQDAFKARGADIGVYPGVVNGTKLHDIVMAENGGVGPTQDEIYASKVSISSWTLINFEYDDMSGYIDTPEKKAVADQFANDLRVFAGREYLKGNVVFAARPIVSCLPDKVSSTPDAGGYYREYMPASRALYNAISAMGSGGSGLIAIGGILTTEPAHMGGGCETPDQAMRDAHLASIVDPLVERYKVALDTINKCKYNPEAIPEDGRSAQCWGIEPVKK